MRAAMLKVSPDLACPNATVVCAECVLCDAHGQSILRFTSVTCGTVYSIYILNVAYKFVVARLIEYGRFINELYFC